MKLAAAGGLAVALLGLVLVVSSARGSLSLGAPASTTPVTSVDSEAVELAARARQALRRVELVAPGAVLRQVDVDPGTGRGYFRFTDEGATREIMVAPDPAMPVEQWLITTSVSPLVHSSRPGIDLDAFRVGPAAAVRAITTRWQGCTVRSLTLFGGADELTWTAFCNLPDGRVAAGTLDNRTGRFEPSPAPPAYPPLTATP